MKKTVAVAIGSLIALKDNPRQSQRGLSQSTEIAILLAAALAIALVIGGLVTAYVRNKMKGFN